MEFRSSKSRIRWRPKKSSSFFLIMKKTIKKTVKQLSGSKGITFNKKDNKRFKIELGDKVEVNLEEKKNGEEKNEE